MTAFLAIMLIALDLHMTAVLSYNYNNEKDKPDPKMKNIFDKYGKNLEKFQVNKKPTKK